MNHLPSWTLTQGETRRKSHLTVKNSKISFSQASTKVINLIYNVTSYHILSRWPWNYCGHPNIIVVMNWEWSVFRKFACGLQNSTRDEKTRKHIECRNSSGAARGVQSGAPRSLFLCQWMQGWSVCLRKRAKGKPDFHSILSVPHSPCQSASCAFTCGDPTGSSTPWRAKVREGEKATRPFIHHQTNKYTALPIVTVPLDLAVYTHIWVKIGLRNEKENLSEWS